MAAKSHPFRKVCAELFVIAAMHGVNALICWREHRHVQNLDLPIVGGRQWLGLANARIYHICSPNRPNERKKDRMTQPFRGPFCTENYLQSLHSTRGRAHTQSADAILIRESEFQLNHNRLHKSLYTQPIDIVQFHSIYKTAFRAHVLYNGHTEHVQYSQFPVVRRNE